MRVLTLPCHCFLYDLVTFLMRIMAGGHSNFRWSCDNCAEPGHHLSGLWASNRSSGLWETFCLHYINITKPQTYILHKLIFLKYKIQGNVIHKERCCDGVGSNESVDPCCGNNLFPSSPQDSYTMPLTSIQCWHVHCEECWLRTLVRLLASFLLTCRLFPLFWDSLF